MKRIGLLALALIVASVPLWAQDAALRATRQVSVLREGPSWAVSAPSAEGAGVRVWAVVEGDALLAQLHGSAHAERYDVDGDWVDPATLASSVDQAQQLGEEGQLRIRSVHLVEGSVAEGRDEPAEEPAPVVSTEDLLGDGPLRVLLYRRLSPGVDGGEAIVTWRAVDGWGEGYRIDVVDGGSIEVAGKAYLASSVLEAFENRVVFIEGVRSLEGSRVILHPRTLEEDESVEERSFLCRISLSPDGGTATLTAMGARAGELEFRLERPVVLLVVAGGRSFQASGTGAVPGCAWVRCRLLRRSRSDGDEGPGGPALAAVLASSPLGEEELAAWLEAHPRN